MPAPLTYRQLLVAEWDQLSPEFASRSVPMPDPKLSSIYAAFDYEGALQAFLVCTFKLHTEPLVSYNPLAIPGLLAHAEQSLISMGFRNVECYIGATDIRVRELAWLHGFHPNEVMFVKRIGGATNGRSEEAKARDTTNRKPETKPKDRDTAL